MTKGELSEICLRAVMGGDVNPDLIQRYHPDEIKLYVAMAFNDVVREVMSNDTTPGSSDIDSLLKFYPDIPVAKDGDRWSSVLPASPLQLSDGKGVHEVIMHEKEFSEGATLDGTNVVVMDAQFPFTGATSVAINPDGNTTYVGTENGVWIYDRWADISALITPDTPVAGDMMPREKVIDLSIGFGGRLYVAMENSVWVYEPLRNVGLVLVSPSTIGPAISCIEACKNYASFAVGGEGGEIWIYNNSKSTLVATPGAEVRDIYFGKSGVLVLAATDAGGVLYNILDKSSLVYDSAYVPTTGPGLVTDNITGCWLNENSNRIYLIDNDLSVWELDLDTDASTTFSSYTDAANTIAISGCEDKNFFSVITASTYVRINPNTGETEYVWGDPVDIGVVSPVTPAPVALDESCSDVMAIAYTANNGGMFNYRLDSNRETQKELVYRENNAAKVFRHLEVNCVNDIPGFYIEGSKIFYDTKELMLDQVDIKMFISFDGYEDTDEVPVPMGFDSAVVDKVKEMLIKRPERDRIVDREEDQAPPDNIKG